MGNTSCGGWGTVWGDFLKQTMSKWIRKEQAEFWPGIEVGEECLCIKIKKNESILVKENTLSCLD